MKPLFVAGEKIYCQKCGELYATATQDINRGDPCRSSDFEFAGGPVVFGAEIKCQCGAGIIFEAHGKAQLSSGPRNVQPIAGKVVGMFTFKEQLFVATENGVYVKGEDDVLRPVQFSQEITEVEGGE